MAKKAENPTLHVTLRGLVRDVLRALPAGRRANAGMIAREIRGTFGYADAGDDLIEEAIAWNHGRNYIDFWHNHNESRDEWFLTPRGEQQ